MDWELTAALNCRHETRQTEGTPKAHRHKRYNHKLIARSQQGQVAETGRVLGDRRVHLPIKGRCVHHVGMSGKDVDSRVLSLVYIKAKTFVRFDLCYLVKSVVSRQQKKLTHLMSVQGRYCQ